MAASGPHTTVPSRKRNRLCHNDYKIACFAPLGEELAPLRAMLDSVHDDLPITPDRNAYVLGEIGCHNVVLVQLCATGTHETSAAAMQLQHDFPAIKFALLVGVAGGIPNGSGKEDIRLGDIVVSVPDGISGGVIQYDRGRRHNVDKFQITSYLNKPAPFLNATVKKIKGEQESGGSRIPLFISDMLRKHPAMRNKYSYQGYENDILYHPEYEHVGGATCQTCDVTRILQREARRDDHPRVHYGTIGSSNGVLRSATERDRLGREHGILCVEMEAAGLMDTLPCLVIRGICDYADSHKNKIWQPYAATTAAAYVKEFLQAVPLTDTTIGNIRPPPPATITSTDAGSESVDDRLSALLDSLHFEGMEQRLRDVTQALPRTCEWLLDHQGYRDWISGNDIQNHHGFLWIKGKPGSGKSTIMKATLRQLEKSKQHELIVSYFFHARSTNQMEKSTLGLYQSLTRRLLDLFPHGQQRFLQHFGLKEKNGVVGQWTISELQEYLTIFVQEQKDRPLTIFIDALDEGDDKEVGEMVSFFEDLASRAFHSNTALRICLSSRHFPEINIMRSVSLTIDKEPGHDEDITTYIRTKLVRGSQTDMEELRTQIQNKSGGIFLWVVLVVKILNTVYGKGNSIEDMTQSLEAIPKELNGLFSSILARDDADITECISLLQWVLFARRSLSPDELYMAVRLRSTAETVNEVSLDLERRDRYLLNRSRGLTEIINSKPPSVQFIHETVREFLVHKGLAQINQLLQHNVRGLSHDAMKVTCQTYVEIVFPLLNAEGRNRILPKDEQQAISTQYPLLDYAVHNMFWHADVAEAQNIPQRNFLQRYNSRNNEKLQEWAHLRNLFQLYKVRRYTSGIYLLYIVVEQGLEHLLEALTKSPININQQGERFGSALQAACAAGSVSMVDRLIRAGADVNLEGGEFGHVVCTAIQYKREAVMQLLSQRSISCKSKVFVTRLFTCLARGYVRGVEVLLDMGVPVNSERSMNGMTTTPLGYAVKKEMGEAIELLVRKGASTNLHIHSTTVLSHAARRGWKYIVQIVLDNGADVNEVSGEYGTALQAASNCGSRDTVQILLDNGADANAVGGFYGTALQAASRFGSRDIVQILLDNGADANAESGFYGTALQAASHFGSRDIVQILLDNGADVNAVSGDYGTALQAASRSGFQNIVQILLDNGADANAEGGYYGTALQAASRFSHQDIVQILLDNGADVNAEGGYYGTALQAASGFGSRDIVQILLDNGADAKQQYSGEYNVIAESIAESIDF